ncbi:MAG: ABC transporter ATP-binding protein [Proteobacteria bacterium]|nr:ABC transporter ATP-binding protein [Pseudomonadota bacterium]
MRRGFAPWADAGARALLRLQGVSKRYGDIVAVDALDLDIFEGEFFALLGPSGCGKTTLLRLLAGFETPAQGSILLAGEDIAAVPPYRRPVNMMFQTYALFPHLSVAGNIAFGLRQERLGRAAIEARVAEMLALVQLEGLGARKPHQLSGGQRQRVALARALAKRPRVLLLDEPLAALDKKLRAQTQFELVNLQARLGTTFVIVTHDQEEAMTMAHRIGVMDRGRLMQVAEPSELYEQPNSRWVAGFIGEVNLIEGRVAALEPGIAVVAALGGHFRVGATAGVGPGDSVCIAVRPEKVRVANAPAAAPTDNCLAGSVVDIGYLGGMSSYQVRVADGFLVRAAIANATRRTTPPIGWDTQVCLTFAPQDAVLLTR